MATPTKKTLTPEERKTVDLHLASEKNKADTAAALESFWAQWAAENQAGTNATVTKPVVNTPASSTTANGLKPVTTNKNTGTAQQASAKGYTTYKTPEAQNIDYAARLQELIGDTAGTQGMDYAARLQELGGGKYAPSENVLAAQQYLQRIVDSKPADYQSRYGNQLDALYNQIMNRKSFSYDMNGDALYQQARDKYQMLGQQAMQDTMGQAAALTGGYGNSYAASAGQQAYQASLQQLNDLIPQFRQQAFDIYQQEGQDLQNRYALTQAAEQLDYGRWQDSVANWQNERAYAQSAYENDRSFDYNDYANRLNTAMNMLGYERDDAIRAEQNARDDAYMTLGYERDDSIRQTEYERDDAIRAEQYGYQDYARALEFAQQEKTLAAQQAHDLQVLQAQQAYNTAERIAQQAHDIDILNRQQQYNTSERLGQQEYNTSERIAGQQYNTSERIAGQEYDTSERVAGQEYNTAERVAGQEYNTAERVAGQEYDTSERLSQQEYNTSERLGQQEYNTAERVAGQEYNTAERLGQQEYNTDMQNAAWNQREKEIYINQAYEDRNNAQQQAYTYAMAVLSEGGMPTDETLALARIPKADALIWAKENGYRGKGGSSGKNNSTTTGNTTTSNTNTSNGSNTDWLSEWEKKFLGI